jgi:hypothetical protein
MDQYVLPAGMDRSLDRPSFVREVRLKQNARDGLRKDRNAENKTEMSLQKRIKPEHPTTTLPFDFSSQATTIALLS